MSSATGGMSTAVLLGGERTALRAGAGILLGEDMGGMRAGDTAAGEGVMKATVEDTVIVTVVVDTVAGGLIDRAEADACPLGESTEYLDLKSNAAGYSQDRDTDTIYAVN